MDQHTFLELVVLGAAITLSGYIGYAAGMSRGAREEYRRQRAEAGVVYFGDDAYERVSRPIGSPPVRRK